MMKTKNKSLYKHIGLATLGAALMLGLVLMPRMKVKASVVWEDTTNTLSINNVDNLDRNAVEANLESVNVDKNDVVHMNISGCTLAADCSGMFRSFNNMQSISFFCTTTSNVTNMSSFFYECNNLYQFDFDVSFTTENVENMNYMFYYCGHSVHDSFTSLDLSCFNTGKVTEMHGMFSGCYAQNLNISSFNTVNVTDMSSMFEDTYTSTISFGANFKTGNVTNMSSMFENTTASSISFGENFDTSKVTTMERMFYNADFTSLDLSGFNTSSVTTMEEMFGDCQTLKSLNISSFNTSSVTDMSHMFYNCYALTSLDVSSFNTASVTTMTSMFFYCSSLKTLDLSSFDTSKVTRMTGMFQACYNLETIYVGINWTNSHVITGHTDLFRNCYKLTGSAGTKYDGGRHSTYKDEDDNFVSFAQVDGGSNSMGYLSSSYTPLASLTADTATFNLVVYFPLEEHSESYIIQLNDEILFDPSAEGHGDDMSKIKIIDGKTYFPVSMTCAAKEIADTKPLTVRYKYPAGENKRVYYKEISIAHYLKAILADSNQSAYHAVAGEMLRYGGAAQVYFNYNYSDDATKLANYGVEGYDSFDNIPFNYNTTTFNPDEITANINDNTEYNVTYAGMNIVYDSNLAFMIAFKMPDGIPYDENWGYEGVKYRGFQGDMYYFYKLDPSGQTYPLSFSQDLSTKYVVVRNNNINIKDLGKTIYRFGSTEVSIPQYLYRVVNSQSASVSAEYKTLCKSLYAYYEQAKDL